MASHKTSLNRLIVRWLVPATLLTVAFFAWSHGSAPDPNPTSPNASLINRVSSLDRVFFDHAINHPLKQSRIPEGSAIVLIDDDTLEIMSRDAGMRWPFPRMAFAALITSLHKAGAEKIIFDFTFIEHSESAEQDILLAGTAAGIPSVILASAQDKPVVFWPEDFRREHPTFFNNPRTGSVDYTADYSDNVIRSYAITGSLVAPSFTPPATAPGGLLTWYGNLEELKQLGMKPLSAVRFIKAGLPMLDRASQAAPEMTPAQLAAAINAEPNLTGPGFDDVRGKTVFVGANASGTFDLKTFPVGAKEPGLLLHWTAWANQKSSGFITVIHPLYSLIAALAAIALIGFAGQRGTGLAFAAIMAGPLFVAFPAISYAGLSAGWFFAPATPAIASVAALLCVAVARHRHEQQRKGEIQAMFGSYVAPAVVEQLLRDPEAIKLGGERRECSVYFSDLAGFTDLSEKIPVDQMFAVVNAYLQESSDALMAHGAYIDKYIGDAVMAVFGAPLPLEDHALSACLGALAARDRLAILNERLIAQFGQRLNMRIGINTGQMIVGNLGSERKKNYTVMGDAVNLASRLEGANKEFGTGILLGETTARLIQGKLATRPLTRLRVKGKNIAIEVHELVGEPGKITSAEKAFLDAYNTAYTHLTARRFTEAAAAFTLAASRRPDDSVTAEWLAKATEFARTPPEENWQPLLKLDSK